MESINYRDSYECRNLRYEDMSEMTVDDAVFILQEWVNKFHKTRKSGDSIDMCWLPRARLIRAYEIAIDSMKNSMRSESLALQDDLK